MEQYCYRVSGMHCANCEVLLERRFKQAIGVVKVTVNHVSGKAKIISASEPSFSELQKLAQAEGYDLSLWNGQVEAGQPIAKPKHWQTGAIFLLVVALYLLLSKINLIPSLGVTDNMSYGFIFVIGLVAAVSSCLAVTGGLLLALAAKYNEAHPIGTRWQKFQPHWYFNLGRLIGYGVFGALIGALGSVFALSSWLNGVITIIASLAMILLGFNLLNLFPRLKILHPRMPKALAHRIHNLSTKGTKSGSFILGALTFFLPCGFTQSLQLYVLAQGNAVSGGLVMLVFALGTLPALLSVGVLSSFLKSNWQNYFLKTAGSIILLIGLVNASRGFALSGLTLPGADVFSQPKTAAQAKTNNIKVVNGRQVANMKIVGYDYFPSRFTVEAGVPVDWVIDASRASGCARVMTVPGLKINKLLSGQVPITISFTPGKTGKIAFSCSMGMTTPGAAFTVIKADDAKAAAENEAVKPACDPNYSNCLEI